MKIIKFALQRALIVLISLLMLFLFVSCNEKRDVKEKNQKATEGIINHVTDKNALYNGEIDDIVVGNIPTTLNNGDKLDKSYPLKILGNGLSRVAIKQNDGKSYYLLLRNDGSLVINQKFNKLYRNGPHLVGSIGDGENPVTHILSDDGKSLFSYSGLIDSISPSGERILVSDFLENEKDGEGFSLAIYKVMDGKGSVLCSFKLPVGMGFLPNDFLVLILSRHTFVIDSSTGRVLAEVKRIREDLGIDCSVCWLPGDRVVVSNNDRILEFVGNTLVKEKKGPDPIGELNVTSNGIPYRVYEENGRYGIRNEAGDIITQPLFPAGFAGDALKSAGSFSKLTPPYCTLKEFRKADGTLLANRIDGFEFIGDAFSEELARVEFLAIPIDEIKNPKAKETRHVGFVNKNLDWVIPPIFNAGTSFEDGIAWVLLDDTWWAIRNPLLPAETHRANNQKQPDSHTVAAMPAGASSSLAPAPMNQQKLVGHIALRYDSDVRMFFWYLLEDSTKQAIFLTQDYGAQDEALEQCFGGFVDNFSAPEGFGADAVSGLASMSRYPVALTGQVIKESDGSVGMGTGVQCQRLEEQAPLARQPQAPPTSQNSSQSGDGPSFDCTKAVTLVEKTICSDAELSALDREFAKVYRRALDAAKDRQSVLSEQRSWLQERERVCGADSNPAECIESFTKSRIAQLKANVASQ